MGVEVQRTTIFSRPSQRRLLLRDQSPGHNLSVADGHKQTGTTF